jgi:hypothetical protein
LSEPKTPRDGRLIVHHGGIGTTGMAMWSGRPMLVVRYNSKPRLYDFETDMAQKSISINRAPVLTLWAAVVAQRLGFDEDEALTLGRAVAGLNAQAKGRRLGIFKPHEDKPKKAREKAQGERFLIEVLGRPVPATNTADGIRAVGGTKPIDPDSVRRYLDSKFGEDLKAVRSAMQKLAKAYTPTELAERAYPLYERFRPSIPEGVKGWGAKGHLDLVVIEGLKRQG